jgi:hypothetical protein
MIVAVSSRSGGELLTPSASDRAWLYIEKSDPDHIESRIGNILDEAIGNKIT